MHICKQRRAGVGLLDALLMVFAGLVFVCLVLLEAFHINTYDRIVFQEDRCVRKNLRALRKAQEMFRVVNPQAKATDPKELMEQVILFAEKNPDSNEMEGCWVVVAGLGQGEVVHPLMDESGKIASDGKVVIRFNEGHEEEFKEGNFSYHLACPANGNYAVGAKTGLPRCSVPGHILGTR